MIVYLLICSSVYGGYNCLPAQPMPSKQVCVMVGDNYRKMTGGYIKTTCLTIRVKP